MKLSNSKDVVRGAAALSKSLTDMDDKIQKKVLRSATTAAAKPVRTEMRKQVKTISKTMAKAIISKTKVYRSSNTAVALVGIKNDPSVRKPYSSDKQKSRGIHDPRFTFHLVDLGTKPHGAKAFGKHSFAHPGTAAQNVRDKALASTQGQSIAMYEAAFTKAVDKALAKL